MTEVLTFGKYKNISIDRVFEKDKNCKNIVLSDPNKKRLDECSKYLDAKFVIGKR